MVSRILISLATLLVWTSASAIPLKNAVLEIEVDPSTGGLSQILDKVTTETYTLTSESPFGVSWKQVAPPFTQFRKTSTEMRCGANPVVLGPITTETETSVVVGYHGCMLDDTNSLNVVFLYTLGKDSPYLTFRIAIDGSGDDKFQLGFPAKTSSFVPREFRTYLTYQTEPTDRAIVTGRGVFKVRDPAVALARSHLCLEEAPFCVPELDGFSFNYGTNSFITALLRKQSAVYTFARSPASTRPLRTAYLGDGTRSLRTTAIDLLPDAEAKKDFVLEAFHVGTVNGSTRGLAGKEIWYEVARAYQQHLIRFSNTFQRGPVQSRPDIPVDLLTGNSAMTYWGGLEVELEASRYADPAFREKVVNLFRRARDYYLPSANAKLRVGLFDGAEDRRTHGPNSLVQYPGMVELYRAMRAQGMPMCVYTLSDVVAANDLDYNQMLLNHAAHNEQGAPQQFENYLMLRPDSLGWSEYVLRNLLPLVQGGGGVGCSYNDAPLWAGQFLFDYTPGTNRPLGPSSDYYQRQVADYQNFVNKVRTADPEYFAFGEARLDALVPVYGIGAFSDDGVSPIGAFVLKKAWNAHLEPMSFDAAVYHPYAITFSLTDPRNFVGPGLTFTDYLWRLAYDALQAGAIPSVWELGRWYNFLVPNADFGSVSCAAGDAVCEALKLYLPRFAAFSKRLIALRQSESRYLIAGQWYPEPPTDSPTKVFAQQTLVGTASTNVPQIVASAWRSGPDLAIFLSNPQDSQQLVHVTAPFARYDLPNESDFALREIRPRQQRHYLRNVRTVLDLNVALSADQTVGFELVPAVDQTAPTVSGEVQRRSDGFYLTATTSELAECGVRDEANLIPLSSDDGRSHTIILPASQTLEPTTSISCVDGYGNRAPDAVFRIPKEESSPSPTVTSTPNISRWRITRKRLVKSIVVKVLRDGLRIGRVHFRIRQLRQGNLTAKSVGAESLVSVQPIRLKRGGIRFCAATPRGQVCSKATSLSF